MKSIAEPARGDLIEVHWVDIYEDSVGDPRTAKLARRISIGYFWEKRLDGSIPVLVTTITLEQGSEDVSVSGYTVYPESCVLRVKMVRRKRRKREAHHLSPQLG